MLFVHCLAFDTTGKFLNNLWLAREQSLYQHFYS